MVAGLNPKDGFKLRLTSAKPRTMSSQRDGSQLTIVLVSHAATPKSRWITAACLAGSSTSSWHSVRIRYRMGSQIYKILHDKANPIKVGAKQRNYVEMIEGRRFKTTNKGQEIY